jgi:hypothetical protein
MGAIALFIAGCGVSHYQAKMLEEQERIRRFDEENKLLDAPLQLPSKKKDDKGPARPVVFIRPPKGISSTAEAHEKSSILYRYRVGSKSNLPFLDVIIGAEALEPDKFWGDLLKGFPGAQRGDSRRVEKTNVGGDKLLLEELQHEDFWIYVYPAAKPQAAVVFHLDPAKREDPSARKLMDLSLGTLAVGQEASRLQRAFERKRRAGPR